MKSKSQRKYDNYVGTIGKYLICFICLAMVMVVFTGCSSSVGSSDTYKDYSRDSSSSSGFDSNGSSDSSSSSYPSSSSSSDFSSNSYDSSSSDESSDDSLHGTRKTCIACHGAGVVEQYYTDDPAEEPHLETCELCDGKGYYYE